MPGKRTRLGVEAENMGEAAIDPGIVAMAQAIEAAGADSPARMRMRLVLPLPLVPRSQVTLPGSSRMSRPSNSRRRPRLQASPRPSSVPGAAGASSIFSMRAIVPVAC